MMRIKHWDIINGKTVEVVHHCTLVRQWEANYASKGYDPKRITTYLYHMEPPCYGKAHFTTIDITCSRTYLTDDEVIRICREHPMEETTCL